MSKKKRNKKKWTKSGIAGTAIGSLVGVSILLMIVYMAGGIALTESNPFDRGLCNYEAYSSVDYPIYHTPLGVGRWELYFDGYGVDNDMVTVHGYWYVDGIFWRKCDGDMKFTTTEPFVPILRREHNITILEQSCPEKNK